MTVIHRHVARAAALLALMVLSAACSMLQPMTPYDPEIEKGVSAYHQSLDSFILKMDRLGRTKDPAGRYDGNLAFYDDARATVDTLTLRAEAQDVTHSCVVPDVVRQVLGAAGGGALPAPVTAASDTTPAAGGGGVDCTVQMLRNVRGQIDTLAQIHQVETYLTGPLAQRTRDITAQSLRAILAVEFAKKRNQM
ncbi:hypothetical protein [Azospirillum rugosum]|uniref:Lipoprotein n=1 Tax=Azospirillum rugosum TaxID=416170 RepID=A0ABS4SXD0_9PROT|nr:hypothetical protein [Azospirillum rugosum]MBP2296914.1 hypothetical protein [Azospirillum rugosum]MDQ0530673.1 hypothetical protein [Azospirillum rugosum]